MKQEVFEDTLKQLYEVRKGMQRKIKAQSERINQLEYEQKLNHNACSQLTYLRNKSINDDMRIEKLERIIVRLKKEQPRSSCQPNAHWSDNCDSYVCSNCRFECGNPYNLEGHGSYCPRCGAYMHEED